jgi:hypothetical protein
VNSVHQSPTRIAQRFNAGVAVAQPRVPKGRLSRSFFIRPFGTRPIR